MRLKEDKQEAKQGKSNPDTTPEIIKFLCDHGDLKNAPEIFNRIIKAKDFDITAKDENGRNLTFYLSNGTTTNCFRRSAPNLQYAKVLIAAKANFNLPDKDGITPLMTYEYEPGVIQFLLAHGADFKALDSKHKTAAERWYEKTSFKYERDIEFLKLHLVPWLELAKKDVAAGIKDQVYAGWTALHLAVIMKDHHFFQASYSPSSFDRVDSSGNTPLMLAFICGNYQAAQFLASKGASTSGVNRKKQNLLHLAFLSISPQTMGFVQIAINDVHQSREAILSKISACDIDNYTPMELLFPSYDDEKMQPVRYQAIELLLKLGDNPYSKKVRNPLSEAISDGDLELTSMLLNRELVQHPINPNFKLDKSDPPIIHALHSRSPEIVDLLLKNGADLKSAVSNRLNILHSIVRENDVQSLKLFLEAINNDQLKMKLMEQLDDFHKTPLDSLMQGYHGVLQYNQTSLLLQHGAKTDTKDRSGNTPLHNVIQTSNRSGYLAKDLPVIKLLLEYKAPINAVDNDGRTPLMYAAGLCFRVFNNRDINRPKWIYNPEYDRYYRPGQMETVKLLLENRAQIDIKDKDGKTAIDHAKESQSKDVLELLQQKLAIEKATAPEPNPLQSVGIFPSSASANASASASTSTSSVTLSEKLISMDESDDASSGYPCSVISV